MHDDRQDDTARFMQSIVAFSAEIETVGDAGRRISSSGDKVLTAILNEIAETVLRRYLTFATQDGLEVQIDVAERRVHRILAIPRDWCEDFGALAGVDLSEGHGPDVLQLLARLREGQGDLYVRTGLPDREKAAGFKGVTILELQEAQAASAVFSNLPVPLATALSSAQACAVACVVLADGQMRHGAGEPSFQQSLQAICVAAVSEAGDVAPVQLWQTALSPGSAVIVAQNADVTLGLLVPETDMMPVFSQLNRAVSQPG